MIEGKANKEHKSQKGIIFVVYTPSTYREVVIKVYTDRQNIIALEFQIVAIFSGDRI